MPQSVKDQIDAMLNVGVGTASPSTEVIVTEAPGTELASTDPPSTESPGTESPGTKAPSTEAPTTEAPAEDEETKRLREENEKLRKQVEDSHSLKTEAPKTRVPTTESPIDEIDFLGSDVDLDELTRDAKMFNTILNKVHAAGVRTGRAQQEGTLRSIPDIVKSNVSLQATLKKEVDSFYSNNEDLRPFKKVVAAVYEELGSENPDWTVAKTFTETEKETRKRLELHRKAGSTEAPTTAAPKGPKFAKVKGKHKTPKPSTDSLLNEIDEMNKGI